MAQTISFPIQVKSEYDRRDSRENSSLVIKIEKMDRFGNPIQHGQSQNPQYQQNYQQTVQPTVQQNYQQPVQPTVQQNYQQPVQPTVQHPEYEDPEVLRLRQENQQLKLENQELRKQVETLQAQVQEKEGRFKSQDKLVNWLMMQVDHRQRYQYLESLGRQKQTPELVKLREDMIKNMEEEVRKFSM